MRGSGVKLWLDGSPPTALMSKPFVNEVDPSDKNYTGVQVRVIELYMLGLVTIWLGLRAMCAHAVM